MYVSDIGRNAGSPVPTGLHILDDPDYPSVPKAATHPDAAYDALPVDDNCEVVPPVVPTDSRFQLSPTNSSVIGQLYLHVHTSL